VLEPRTLRLPLTPPVKPHTRRANNTSAIDTYPRLTFNEVLIYYHYHHIFNSHDPQLNRIILIHLPFDAYHIHNIISCYSIPNNSKHINFNHLNFNLSSYSQFNHTHTHTHTHIYILHHVIYSHVASCISLHYLIITFSFTIQISCILQYQFINIYYIHNTNLMQYSTSIQCHAIIHNTNLMHSSMSIHQHILSSQYSS